MIYNKLLWIIDLNRVILYKYYRILKFNKKWLKNINREVKENFILDITAFKKKQKLSNIKDYIRIQIFTK